MASVRMRRYLTLTSCSFGVALLAISLPGELRAQNNTPGPVPMAVPPTPVPGTLPSTDDRVMPPPFQQGPFGHQPHLGQGDDGGQGYKHYDEPNHRYGHWYRPKALGWGNEARCAPSPFRPRGYGNLFNEPSTCYRLDYNRFALKSYRTEYGPSYYRRLPDPRCAVYGHAGRSGPGCDACDERKTKVWTVSGSKNNR